MAIAAPITPPEGNMNDRVDGLEKKLEALTLQLSKLIGAGSISGFGTQRPSNNKRRSTMTPPLLAPPSPAASDISSGTTASKEEALKPFEQLDEPPVKRALAILDIIQRYGQNSSPADIPWAGKARFLPMVESRVRRAEPIPMVLPAFPFKSPNRANKVVGSLPDLGEELALRHLDGLCESIREIYEPGAKVFIASDGLVYNDLLGVTDEDVWEYSTAIRDMIREKELKNIDTYRLIDLVGGHEGELTKARYLEHASCFRRELVARFTPPGLDSHELVKTDKDVCMTYKGYVKFLSKDLESTPAGLEANKDGGSKKQYKKHIERIAYDMIGRGKAFAIGIDAKCKDFVRLSIHPSTGETKLSVPLIPQARGHQIMTPWHSSIAVGVDGSFRTVHAEDVRDTHDLVYRNGRPYFFRERSPLFDFGTADVEIEHLYPTGLIVHAHNNPKLSEVDVQKLRALAEFNSPVVLRGFSETTNKEIFQKRAYDIGEVQEWTFGIMQSVKDAGRRDKMANNVSSNEAMPMHYDGMFKFVPKLDENGEVMKDENGKEIKYQKPPKFQYFTCIETSEKGTGYTLFAASRLFFKYLPHAYSVERLEKARWRMDNDGFWDAKVQNLPLVVRHPVHNTPCVRWHEPWGADKTKYSTCEITIENDSQDITPLVDSLLYDRRVCLRFEWERGDILVSDNVGMLHTRTAFTGDSDRELWRIHFD